MVKQKTMKKFEELKFSDYFMFGKVMEDSELCREVLECLLQRSVGELTTVESEREFKYTSDGKPIRLDVYNEDIDGSVYDVEMENLNRKSIESHQLPQRSRFYQASIDVDYLDKGKTYKSLPSSDVIFICTFDPFKRGLCTYTFHERCDEDTMILLNDGTTKNFFNCTYKGKDIPEQLKEFYNYIRDGKPTGPLTEKINKAVVIGRRNEAWRTQYMREWVALQDAKDEGYDDGYEAGKDAYREEIINNMLRLGKEPEEIALLCDLPEEYVKEVKTRLTKGQNTDGTC